MAILNKTFLEYIFNQGSFFNLIIHVVSHGLDKNV